MIVPMKKYSFLVYHKEYEAFLNNIQNLGVVHVVEKHLEDEENELLQDKYLLQASITKAIKFLEKRDVEFSEEVNGSDGIKILNELNALQQKTEDYSQELANLKKDIKTIEPWGEFKWKSINKLKEAGITLRFFQAPQRKFEEEIRGNYFVEEINNISGHVYFVLATREGEEEEEEEEEEEVEIDAEEMHISHRSLNELKKQKDEIIAIQNKTEEVFDHYAEKYLLLLKDTKAKLSGELAFDKVKLYTRHEADSKLMVLEGWTPVDSEEELNRYLAQSGVYYETEKPVEGEGPPIKLKNNRFARLYESIGELYTMPDYGEIDLTPFFAPFYMLFFGFCLGDAGYGFLITVATIIGMVKAPVKYKPVLKLGMFLGISTTIMGVIGGTFFGIFLLEVEWTWIQKYQAYMLDSDKLMMVSLALGYIQVLLGMFIKAANKAKMYGFKHSISQLGWNVIVMVAIPAFALGNFDIIPSDIGNKVALIALIAGGVPAMFYNSPGKNPLLNLGVGLWDTYQTASGLLGDVLSYIRLFALGISSAILGNVFNTLAMELSPDTIIIRQLVMILILAFGHSLNLFMAALGSFVHPLRLTFVEFYKNAGFAGGGKKYEPFKK
jgi:V/A-type H+-transporting ATPase subunit I